MGALLASHLFDSLENIDTDTRVAVLNSAVSSTMLEKMARAKNIYFEESLTGFKWMGNTSRKLEESGYYVTFAFEEALGYMFPEVCYDKDGITAAMIFLSAQARWATQGLTPYTKLQQLFAEFGHHETLNNYFRSPNPETSMALFDAIRAGQFRSEMKLGPFKILRWRDMTEGYDSGTEDKTPRLPADKSSQMLTLWLDRDVRFTIRASGTEAKVKCKFLTVEHTQGPVLTTHLQSTLRAVARLSNKPSTLSVIPSGQSSRNGSSLLPRH
jgi:phosphoglucomutase